MSGLTASSVLEGIPTGLVVGGALLLLIQLTLQIVALVMLVRIPSERITIGGRKWVWALIIIFGELVGPVLFFILGRKPAPAVEPIANTLAADRASAAADALYGAPPSPPSPASAPESPSDTPEAFVGDPEIGSDGTGAGELP